KKQSFVELTEEEKLEQLELETEAFSSLQEGVGETTGLSATNALMVVHPTRLRSFVLECRRLDRLLEDLKYRTGEMKKVQEEKAKTGEEQKSFTVVDHHLDQAGKKQGELWRDSVKHWADKAMEFRTQMLQDMGQTFDKLKNLPPPKAAAVDEAAKDWPAEEPPVPNEKKAPARFVRIKSGTFTTSIEPKNIGIEALRLLDRLHELGRAWRAHNPVGFETSVDSTTSVGGAFYNLKQGLRRQTGNTMALAVPDLTVDALQSYWNGHAPKKADQTPADKDVEGWVGASGTSASATELGKKATAIDAKWKEISKWTFDHAQAAYNDLVELSNDDTKKLQAVLAGVQKAKETRSSFFGTAIDIDSIVKRKAALDELEKTMRTPRLDELKTMKQFGLITSAEAEAFFDRFQDVFLGKDFLDYRTTVAGSYTADSGQRMEKFYARPTYVATYPATQVPKQMLLVGTGYGKGGQETGNALMKLGRKLLATSTELEGEPVGDLFLRLARLRMDIQAQKADLYQDMANWMTGYVRAPKDVEDEESASTGASFLQQQTKKNPHEVEVPAVLHQVSTTSAGRGPQHPPPHVVSEEQDPAASSTADVVRRPAGGRASVVAANENSFLALEEKKMFSSSTKTPAQSAADKVTLLKATSAILNDWNAGLAQETEDGLGKVEGLVAEDIEKMVNGDGFSLGISPRTDIERDIRKFSLDAGDLRELRLLFIPVLQFLTAASIQHGYVEHLQLERSRGGFRDYLRNLAKSGASDKTESGEKAEVLSDLEKKIQTIYPGCNSGDQGGGDTASTAAPPGATPPGQVPRKRKPPCLVAGGNTELPLQLMESSKGDAEMLKDLLLDAAKARSVGPLQQDLTGIFQNIERVSREVKEVWKSSDPVIAPEFVKATADSALELRGTALYNLDDLAAVQTKTQDLVAWFDRAEALTQKMVEKEAKIGGASVLGIFG
ncbi:unnamed protein product, partial [Amoebophrya sp. A120]